MTAMEGQPCDPTTAIKAVATHGDSRHTINTKTISVKKIRARDSRKKKKIHHNEKKMIKLGRLALVALAALAALASVAQATPCAVGEGSPTPGSGFCAQFNEVG